MTKTLGKQQAKTRTCVMAWKALMEQIQADLPYKAFPAADGVVERSYCTQSGLLASGSCPSTAVGYYRADALPDVCNYSHGPLPAQLQFVFSFQGVHCSVYTASNPHNKPYATACLQFYLERYTYPQAFS